MPDFVVVCLIISFNSRSREGSDEKHISENNNNNEVSTRAPVKGATYLLGIASLHQEVSTRAPVKGATMVVVYRSLCVIYVSTRAPVKGATLVKFQLMQLLLMFQLALP